MLRNQVFVSVLVGWEVKRSVHYQYIKYKHQPIVVYPIIEVQDKFW